MPNKYKTRKSPPVSAQLHPKKIMKGNDGNKWISSADKRGVYRWKKHTDDQDVMDPHSSANSSFTPRDLTKLKNFQINRNNSVIVAKPKEKTIMTLNTKGDLYIKLSSKHVPTVNKEVIKINLKKLKYGYYDGELFIFHKKVFYAIRFDLDSRKKSNEIIDNILGKYSKDKNIGNNSDSLLVTKDHHYGELILFKTTYLQKLVPGQKYYIVMLQNWSRDYTGKNIHVLEYHGIEDGKLKTLKGKLYGKSKWTADLMDVDHATVTTGGGDDPVHLITKFRKGFKIPKSLPKAILFNPKTKATKVKSMTKTTSKRYKTRKSPPVSAQLHPKKIMKGNDGNKWISSSDKRGVYRWKKYTDDQDVIDLTKLKNFMITRNNSILVNKPREKTIMTLDNDGNIYIKLSSKYVPKVNKEISKLKKKQYGYEDPFKSNNRWIYFTHKKGNYHISFVLKKNAKEHQMIDKMLNKNKNSKISLNTSDLMDKTPDHHYGDLIIFKSYYLKKLKKGQKYYIVWGQGWGSDYKGYNIGVLEYNGLKEDKFWGKIIDGKIYDKTKWSPWNTEIVSIHEGVLHTGTGADPIHLVTKWRKGFKPPSWLPKARLFK
jgi:cyclophilin family peptidyl-prolyl cis-trans isomerase